MSKSTRWQAAGERLVPWAVPLGLLAIWQLAAQLGWLSTRVAPAPLNVLQTDVVVLAILLYALLGKAADVAARALERNWLRWNTSFQPV